jgi:hypothetical protein
MQQGKLKRNRGVYNCQRFGTLHKYGNVAWPSQFRICRIDMIKRDRSQLQIVNISKNSNCLDKNLKMLFRKFTIY